MPGSDRSGPMGAGPMTGRGLGPCVGSRHLNRGLGFGLGFGLGMACRRGFGRGGRRFLATDNARVEDSRDILEARRDALKSSLKAIEEQLENHKGDES